MSPDPDVPGVLIVGPKGAGKSSLTIALALSGWTLFSDDHVLAWSDGGRLRVSGLRVPLFLTPDTAERLPAHLPKGQPVPAMGKLMFQPDDLFPGQYRNMGRLGAILFPARAPVAESKLERVTALDAFQRLLAHAPFLASDPSARPCIDVARSIADLPAFILHSGSDVLDPAKADRLVRTIFA